MESSYKLNEFKSMSITRKILFIIEHLKKFSLFFYKLAEEKIYEKFGSKDIFIEFLDKTINLNVKSENYCKISENFMKIHVNLNKILSCLKSYIDILIEIKKLSPLENLDNNNNYYQEEKSKLINIIGTIINESVYYLKNVESFCNYLIFDNDYCLIFIEYLNHLNVKCESCFNFLEKKPKEYYGFKSNTNTFLQRKRRNN
jgi:hypothetical protein